MLASNRRQERPRHLALLSIINYQLGKELQELEIVGYLILSPFLKKKGVRAVQSLTTCE